MPGPICFYVPSHIIDHIARHAGRLGLDADAARRTAVASAAVREQRRMLAMTSMDALTAARPGQGDRQIFDDHHRFETGGELVRGEGDDPVAAANVNAAYDGLGATREFFREVLGRDSIDDAGMTLLGDVNYGDGYDNAFWDGTRMVFGNGDDQIFQDFTRDVDVCAHELTHGVTQYTAGLVYTDQAGAMNEAFSDIFAACVDQFVQKVDAGEHNWLIGEEVMAAPMYGEAIRSMAHPGTAYDNPVLGKDPQAAHMSEYVPGGDPHLNSGIMNRAFYLSAIDLGSYPAAKIFYAALRNLWPQAQFTDCAYLCAEQARLLSRDGRVSRHAPQTIRAAFREVGIP
ncbi:Zn-dependent metalloprotease [Actinoplanes octamycinicus]|uniref:Neutral metalloproteinase n=1 Tax=Actinoplanes octamycinicus TaxID=135948 RepID=A0A7W7M882_9ACTN|nr:M4 family metallopeptidase [Actinoplanes octamycinicus]MBB4740580.1 Zn-dependent metalloprotease [Actinoplanes octamycinicus]GIE63119.1 peptidase M4 family protein [Actinoplanes octamycinicus]